MDFIDNPDDYSSLVKRSIARYGHNVEHHAEHFDHCHSSTNKNFFLNFSRGKGVLGSVEYGHTWHLFPHGVLAPQSQRFELFEEFLNYALCKQKAKKVVVEVDEPFRQQILETFTSRRKFKPLTLNYALYWPVFNMKLFDHQLKGKTWKKMRNISNRFKKRYNVRVVDSRDINKEKLKDVIDYWLARRPHTDTVDEDYYYNVVDSGFKGMDVCKTIVVNGEPCSIAAGWKVPNAKGHYYSAIGVVNYKHQGLSEFANLKDLLYLKRKGFSHVDFGGSDYSLLNFKNKFKPHYMYKTYVFSIVRR